MINKKYYKYRQPHRLRKKRSVLRNRYFWFSALFLLFLSGTFYLVCFSNFFQVKEVKIIGNQKTPLAEIQKTIDKGVGQKVLAFFDSNSIFLANLGEITRDLLEEFPQISSATVNRQLPDKLLVEIKERLPFGVWCQGENCFYLDRTGVIFDDNPVADILVIKTQNQPAEVVLGKRIIANDSMEKIAKVQKTLKDNMEINIKEFNIISPDRLNARTQEGWEIYFDPAGNLDWQLTEVKAVLEKQIPSEKRGNLEYIDLRFSKVYYKYR